MSRTYATSLRRVKRLSSDAEFGDKRFLGCVRAEHGRCAKSVNVKTNRRTHIIERVLVGVPLSHDNAAHAEWVGNVAVSVFFNDDLDISWSFSSWLWHLVNSIGNEASRPDTLGA